MEQSVGRKLWTIRWRFSANRFMECVCLSFFWFAFPVLGLIVTEKCLAVDTFSPLSVKIIVMLAILVAVVRWQWLRPTNMALAILLDKRAGLQERTSSVLAFKDSSDPFAKMAIHESRHFLSELHPGTFFPIRLPRRWWHPGVVWGLAFLAWTFIPQGDMLGRQAQRQEQAKKTLEVKQTQAQVKQAVNKVKELASKLDEKIAADLPSDTPAKDPQQAKRMAIRQTADLQKRVQQVRADPKFDGLRELQQRLRQLKSPTTGPIRELSQQLAQGQFDKAAAALKDLQQQLRQGNLSPQQREELAKNLDNLAKQLEKLAQQQWKMENDLKKMGLDPKLSKDLKKLAEALKKMPMTEAQKKKLLQQASANLSACKSCSGLSSSLQSAAAGLNGQSNDQSLDALAQAGEQLDGLESLSQQLSLTEATLQDLSETLKNLGSGTCKACNGKGCSECNSKGPWKEGLSYNQSKGMGGPGRGQGQVSDIQKTDTGTEKTRAKGKNQGGPVIASWYIQDSKIKGQSVRNFSEIAQSAEQQAAEAIENQTIPKEYHDSIKKYFNQLQQSSNASTTQKGN